MKERPDRAIKAASEFKAGDEIPLWNVVHVKNDIGVEGHQPLLEPEKEMKFAVIWKLVPQKTK